MNKKITIYQVLPRLFGNSNHTNRLNGTIEENGCGKLNDFTPQLLSEIKKLGITHIWFTGVIEHATQTDYTVYGIENDHPAVVKGKAGSPYAIKDYYDIAPDLANDIPNRMHEFEQLIERTHQAGLKAIIDFVPNHVSRQYKSDKKPTTTVDLGQNDNKQMGFSPANNFYYLTNQPFEGQFDRYHGADQYVEFPAKATGNDRFDAYPTSSDWYETIKINYGVDYLNGKSHHFDPIPATWTQMLEILLFWGDKKVDGFRCDMAEMVPVEFWEWAISLVKKQHKDILFIAEVYNPNEYRNYLFKGKFDYLYDKVGLYDTLRDVIAGRASATAITYCWQQVSGIENNMLNFLENHDEQRIASDFFASDPQKAFPALIVSACMNKNPLMIYFGQEFGESAMEMEGFSGKDGRTTIFDYWSIESIQNWIQEVQYHVSVLTKEQKSIRAYYQTLLNLCLTEKAISEGVFFDLMYVNEHTAHFNPHKQYVFLRKCDQEALLIAVNFDDQPVSVHIHLSTHAFEYLQLPQAAKIEATDLLTGQKMQISLVDDHYKPAAVDLPKWGGVILKMTF